MNGWIGFRGLGALGFCLLVAAPAAAADADVAPAAPLADAAPEAKKAAELLEGARGLLERATGKGGHREKALESIKLALSAISSATPAMHHDESAEWQGLETRGTELAAHPGFTSALKLLVAAKASLGKAGAAYAGAVRHVDAAIGHVKEAIKAG